MFDQQKMRERMRSIRQERNQTVKEVAIAVDLKRSAVSNWELGIGLPSLESLCKLADYFEVTTDYLLGQSDELKR